MSMRTQTGSFRGELQSSVIQTHWPLLSRPGTDAIVAMEEFRLQVMSSFYHRPVTDNPSPIILFRE
nr:MAG TPA_asm: hypothetical protein [Caudoviricetes sp.]